MKKLLMLPLVAAALVLTAAPAEATGLEISNKTSVAICHNVQNNGHVIIVNINALGAHVAHLGKTDIILGTGLRADLVAQFGDDDAACGHQTPPTTQPPAPDPLVRVCLNGKVESVLTSVQVKLGLTVLGEGEGCPVTPPTTVVVEKEVVKEVVVEREVEVEVPGPTMVIERTVEVPAPVAATPSPSTSPAAPASGELPKTGGSPFLALMGGGVTALGVILRRLFK